MNKLEFLLMNNPLRALIQERYELPLLLSMSTRKSFHTALEIGCGNGNGTRLLKENYSPQKILAIDLDEKMIELARKRAPENF